MRSGQQRPSWIWFTGNICENIQDPVTYTGEYFFEAFLGSIVLIEYQHCGWMGKIKSTVMSLLIRYTHIPFYFHFSFTFPTSLIHHYAPLLQRDRTRSHSLYRTDLAYLMNIWLTIHMYLLLFLASPMCPLLWSDQSRGLAPHGQALSIASPYARILVYHLYLTCLYLPFVKGTSSPKP